MSLRYRGCAGDRGEIGIWRRDGDRWLDLLPWTASGQVRPGGALNDLTVRAIGPHLTFLVNGMETASVEDAALGEGAVGVFVGGDFNDVVLQKLLVQVPELSERDGDPAQQASEHLAEAALRGVATKRDRAG